MPKKRHKKFNKLTSSLKKSVYKKPSADFVLVSSIARQTPYSAEYLSLLVRTGKVFGKKFGRNWFISKKALVGYLKVRGAAPAQQLPNQWRNFISDKSYPLRRSVSEASRTNWTDRPIASLAQEEYNANTQIKTNDANPEKQKPEEIIAADVKKHLDELEKLHRDAGTRINADGTRLPAAGRDSRGQEKVSNFTVQDTSFFRPKFPEILDGSYKTNETNENYYQPPIKKNRWAEILVVSIVTLVLILGGFNLKFANALYGAVKEFVEDATTLQGHTPGTHAGEVLLLDKEGKISIYGHIETQGQFRSFVQQGLAPIVVDSSTTVANLSAEYLDGLSARDFTLQVVTKNGNVTFDNVKLEGGAEIGSLLKVKGAANFLDYISVAKNLSVGGDLVINGRSTLSGGADVFGRLNVKGDIDVTNFIAAQRAQIKEGGLIVSGHTQLNSLGLTGGLSVADLGVSGNFSVAGKDISVGDSWGDKLNVNASSTFSGPFLVSTNEAKFGRGLTVLANGIGITGASSITGNLSVTGDTTLNGNLTLSGTSSGGTSLGIGTSTPGAALGVKGGGIFDGFLSANYFTSTSSLTSWIMGQMGIGTTTPGSQLSVKGAGLFEGFVSADYFTSTSSNTSWLMGQMGIGTTTPGSQLSVNGAILSEGFVSADYFTSTSTNSSWLSGNLGIGTTTPGAKLAVGGDAFVDGLYAMGTTTTSSLIATSTLEVRSTAYTGGDVFAIFKEKVGFGTTTPGSLLSVHGNGNIGELTVEGLFKGGTLTATSTVITAAGTAAAPTYSTLGDSDTGLFFPLANTLAISTGGTERLRFDSTGNVGLARSSPSTAFQVVGDGTFGFASLGTGLGDLNLLGSDLNLGNDGKATSTLTSLGGRLGIYDNSQASTSPGAIFSIHANTTTPAFLLNQAGSGDLFNLETVGLTSLLVRNGGIVGIATSSPNARLEVAGDGLFKGGLYVQATSTMSSLIATSTLEVRSSSYSAGTIFNVFKEKVGLATATPGSLLSVQGVGNIGELTIEGPFKTSYLTSTSTTASYFQGALGLGTTTPGSRLSVSGAIITDGFVSANYFTSTSSLTSWTMGQFGHGTTTPGTELAVKGAGLFEGFISADYFKSTSTNSSWIFGNMGIGTTTPGAQLAINGTVLALTGTSTFNGLMAQSLFSTTSLNYYTNSNATPRMTIDTSGNVGIGTTSPSDILAISSATSRTGLTITNTSAGATAAIILNSTETVQANNRNWSIATNMNVMGDFDIRTSNTKGGDAINAGTSRLTINNNGNVGIGTTSPAALTSIGGNLFVGASSAGGTPGIAFIGGTYNANMTTGVTINQLGADNEILTLKSTDVAHGITTWTETDTYFYIVKYNATQGGAQFTGLSGGTSALWLGGLGVTDNTAKTTGGVGYVMIDARKKSGTTVGNPGADANLLTIGANGTTRFIFDAEGTGHADDVWTDNAYDLAETYDIADTAEEGDVVIMDSSLYDRLKLSTSAYQKAIGAISYHTAQLGESFDGIRNKYPQLNLRALYANPQPVALIGRVPVKVSTENGTISIGDKLTTSSKKGYAMKANGTLSNAIASAPEDIPTFGVALDNFDGSSGDTEIVNGQTIKTGRILTYVTVGQERLLPKIASGVLTEGIFKGTHSFYSDYISTTTPAFMIDSTGNVGIGSTTPNYKLTVAGDIAATSFINISTRTAKKDIEYLSTADEQGVLEKIKSARVATYNYIGESCDKQQETSNMVNPNTGNLSPVTCRSRLGLIAEEAPAEVLSIDGKGVDIYKLSSFILAGVKAQQMQIDALKAQLASLSVNQFASSPTNQSSTGQLANWPTVKLIFTVAKSVLAAITSAMGDWVNGVLASTTKLNVSSENSSDVSYQTYPVLGSREEITASGSATLALDAASNAASARVRFDESFVAAISETESIKVIVTSTTKLNGALYVHAKSRFGFEVREINATDVGGTFDWLVIARKKGGEDAAIGPISPTPLRQGSEGQVGPIAPAEPAPEQAPAPTESTITPSEPATTPPVEIVPPATTTPTTSTTTATTTP